MKETPEKQMTVGYGITVEGRIDNCERLVLDGNMKCELQQVKSLIISKTGFFQGSGHIQQAEISGRFEGNLVVEGHITILETGRVDGTITYGSIEIKPGGKFTGQIILRESDLPPKLLHIPPSPARTSSTRLCRVASWADRLPAKEHFK
jgi:cytoskeletal protein CcmA (bactofilin family)